MNKTKIRKIMKKIKNQMTANLSKKIKISLTFNSKLYKIKQIITIKPKIR